MQSLRRTLPESLDDLTVQVAIVRPGPIQGGAINPYIERRRRLRADPAYEVPYPHPRRRYSQSTLGTGDLPGSGDGSRPGVRRLQRPARPTGCAAR